MNDVQLPPGMKITASAVGVPYGAGRPVRPDPTDKDFSALSEFARAQGAKPSVGRPAFYQNSEELGHACEEYFAWVDANPWRAEKKQFAAKREMWATTDEKKKVPYTQIGLCCYLGISQDTWKIYEKQDHLKQTVAWAEKQIARNKFDGAASGFYNHSIIARDLGLADKQEITGAGGGPIEKITSEMTAAEAAERYAKTREG